MKVFLKLTTIIISMFIVLCIAMEADIIYFGNNVKAEKSDCIIILGCSVYGKVPSPFLEWRTEEGLKLYKMGYGKYIIVSGGKGPGEDISEASAIENYLLSNGVPKEVIIKEDKSRNTEENIFNSKAIMDNKGFQSGVIVSNKFHLKRAQLLSKDAGIKSSFSGVFVRNHKPYEYLGYIREVPAIMKYYIYKHI